MNNSWIMDFIFGMFLGGFLLFVITLGYHKSEMYEFKKEAHKRGYMEKVITEKDTVEYKWVEEDK